MADNVVIIGSGPAAHTAAIYAARANLSPILFEGFMENGLPGRVQLLLPQPGTHIGDLGSDLLATIWRFFQPTGTVEVRQGFV